MKNPIPLLSVALAFVIFGSAYISNRICSRHIVADFPTTSYATLPIAETNKLTASKEIVLNFKYNDTQINAKNEMILLQEYLRLNPNSALVLYGHTDNIGSDGYNLQLSEYRANFVMSLLVRAGISATKITTKGMGENNPFESNETAEGRRQNRRVVVQFF